MVHDEALLLLSQQLGFAALNNKNLNWITEVVESHGDIAVFTEVPPGTCCFLLL
jgi:hypothetical protein